MYKRQLSACLLSAALLTAPFSASANNEVAIETAKEPLKVLFHVSEKDRLDAALGNTENLLKSLQPGETAQIEVVMNGTAPDRADASKPELQSFTQYLKAAYRYVKSFFVSSNDQKLSVSTLQRMQNLTEQNQVRFVVCKTSLKGLGIDENNIPKFISVVPAGVTELARKENEGYAYLKP